VYTRDRFLFRRESTAADETMVPVVPGGPRWSPVVPGGPRWSPVVPVVPVVPGGLSVFQQISDILHSVGDPTVCMWSLFEVVGQTGQYTMDRVDCGTSLT